MILTILKSLARILSISTQSLARGSRDDPRPGEALAGAPMIPTIPEVAREGSGQLESLVARERSPMIPFIPKSLAGVGRNSITRSRSRATRR
ncbi:MAG: hypothetical protein H6705_01870 [Myxococcales bacterium]|nr:hypothetical protein [Myxococcales bacterium]